MKKIIMLLLLIPCLLYGQTYMSDLKNGDIPAVERKLGFLNTSFAKEPILERYLENSGANSDIVETLIKKGAKINGISPSSKLTPLFLALKNEQDPIVIKTLLKYGATFNMTIPGVWGSNLIDYAIYSEQYRSAYFIIKANAKLPVGNRLRIDNKYSKLVSVMTDQVEVSKNIIAADGLSERRLWLLAVSGSAKNILSLLIKLYPQPDIDKVILKLLVDDPDLIKYLANIGFSLTRNHYYEYKDLWEYVLEKSNNDLITSYINIYPDGASANISSLLEKDPARFISLVDQGVKINETKALWEVALKMNQGDVYNRLIKCGPVPDDILVKGMQTGDESLSSIMESGYRVSPDELKETYDNDTRWNWMIKEKFNRTLTFLIKHGYQPPQDSVIIALAYNDVIFPLMVEGANNINKEYLGTTAYEDLLAIEIAIKDDRWKNLASADNTFKIFEPEKPIKEKNSYPQDRERSKWKYYCLLSKNSSDRRGYAWAGYNDFLTNNFNVLCFLIAAKYDKPELAEYILKRDPSIVKGTVFTRDETISPDTTYKYLLKEFIKKHYYDSSVARLLR